MASILIFALILLVFIIISYIAALYIAIKSLMWRKNKSEALVVALNNMAFISPNLIKKLVKKGADVNYAYYVFEERHTPLLKAILNNCSVKIIKELVTQGADINVKMTDNSNLLMLAAAFYKNPKIVDLFIEQGLNINHQNNNGSTALIYAAKFSKNPRFISKLIDKGADIMAVDECNRKAFSYLDENETLSRCQVCKELLKAE